MDELSIAKTLLQKEGIIIITEILNSFRSSMLISSGTTPLQVQGTGVISAVFLGGHNVAEK